MPPHDVRRIELRESLLGALQRDRRLQEAGDRLAVGEANRPTHIVLSDRREVAPQQPFAVVSAERGLGIRKGGSQGA